MSDPRLTLEVKTYETPYQEWPTTKTGQVPIGEISEQNLKIGKKKGGGWFVKKPQMWHAAVEA
jgi:hypothetical protein